MRAPRSPADAMIPSPGRTDSQGAGARKQIDNAMPLLTFQTYRFHSIQTCRSRVMEFLGQAVAEVDLGDADSPLSNGSGREWNHAWTPMSYEVYCATHSFEIELAPLEITM
jgi:hypothetical protein